MSQSSICDINAVGVVRLAINKRNCVFANRIVFSERINAFNRSA